jgi:sugar-specific transcriptional regulator TrmB
LDQNLVISKFIELGMSEPEVKIYLFLSKKGPQKVKEISKLLKISRVQIYRHLKLLQGKGFIKSSFGHPIFFSAYPLDKTIDLLIESKTSELMLLKRNREELKNLVKEFELSPQTSTEGETFSVIENEKTICTLIYSFPRNSKNEVKIMIDKWHRLIPDGDKFSHAIKNSLKQGKIFKIICLDTELNREYSAKYHEKFLGNTNFKEQFLKANNIPCFLMADESELILPVENDHFGHIKKIVITNNLAMILQAKFVFEKIWGNNPASDSKNVLELKNPEFYSSDYKLNSWALNMPFMRCGELDLSSMEKSESP